MFDLPRNNFGSHLGIKLGIILGQEIDKDEAVHTDRFLDELQEFLLKICYRIGKRIDLKKSTLTGCPPALYPDIMPHSLNEFINVNDKI